MACFTLRGGDFKNVKPGFCNRCHRRASRLAHDNGGLEILREEQSFHDAHVRLVFFQNVAQRLGNFARQRERSQSFGQEMVPCASVTGAFPPVRMTPKPVPRSDGSMPRIICVTGDACRAADGCGNAVERLFFPLKRSCICSNCCLDMPTRTGCQRRSGGKSKNAAQLTARRCS